MPCNTWILLLLLTVVLFWGQLSSTVPDGTLKKRDQKEWVTVSCTNPWWECWASTAGAPTCCRLKLKWNSTAFPCVHTLNQSKKSKIKLKSKPMAIYCQWLLYCRVDCSTKATALLPYLCLLWWELDIVYLVPFAGAMCTWPLDKHGLRWSVELAI